MITTLQTTLVSIFPHLLRIWRRVIYKPFSTIKSEYPNIIDDNPIGPAHLDTEFDLYKADYHPDISIRKGTMR